MCQARCRQRLPYAQNAGVGRLPEAVLTENEVITRAGEEGNWEDINCQGYLWYKDMHMESGR